MLKLHNFSLSRPAQSTFASYRARLESTWFGLESRHDSVRICLGQTRVELELEESVRFLNQIELDLKGVRFNSQVG